MFRLQPPLPDDYSTAPEDELIRRVSSARSLLGKRLVILGHHYQREEVIRFADERGDSFGLSRFAADQHEAEFVVFCGVHFMAESADILTGPHQQVILPDLNAGCSMADMADLDGVEQVWDELAEVTDIEASRADHLHELGRGAEGVRGPQRRRRLHLLERPRRAELGARARRDGSGTGGRGEKVLFFPDQHLGRNTGFQLGYGAADMRVVDPRRPLGGLAGRRGERSHAPAVEGPLLGAPALLDGARRGVPRRASRRHRDRASRVLP